MTAVFVHGVPETSELWDGIRKELAAIESVALSRPGFGVPVPKGFGATMDEYTDWLVSELEKVDARSTWWATTGAGCSSAGS